ncbi:PLP-dependent aminotransferase family protein [Streptacidiphilus sp. NEAU-YB345]|uniref:PLP-dependent aminotransferase family protein n=1 Tax=Streptacidiphilus fuscans TaxID=2789292 RepID=A0A931B7Q1_9ACTN|nr:PLP-dependent aminotransferase family protein [Streptacidiphilus fuscans]
MGDWQRPGQGPAYRALAGGLRTLVLDGRVPVEARLPAERELSAALGVSRTTVTAAFELLRDEGFLASRRGAGSWTALPPGRTVHGAGLSPLPADLADSVIDLGIAAPSAPEPFLSEAMAAALTQLPQYTDTHGDFPLGIHVLRHAVADRFTARGLPTDPEQIMITTGAAGGFSLLLRHLLAPAERVAVESPSYANSLQALRFAGSRVVPVALHPGSEATDGGNVGSGNADGANIGGWDVDGWSRTLRDAAPRLGYLIPDFHNPTGMLMSEDERRALVAAARRTGTTLIADETMAELSLEPDLVMPPPLAAFDPGGGTVITLGSTGKTFWGGLRIGWIRASPDLVRRLRADRSSLDVSSPVLEQLAVAHLLSPEVLPQVLAHQRHRIRVQRDALVSALRTALPDWTFRTPLGGLSLWVHTPDGVSGSVLATTAERFGVWVGSGPRFGVDGVLERFVRLPYAHPAEVLGEAVRRLAAASATLTGPHRPEPGRAEPGTMARTSEIALL